MRHLYKPMDGSYRPSQHWPLQTWGHSRLSLVVVDLLRMIWKPKWGRIAPLPQTIQASCDPAPSSLSAVPLAPSCYAGVPISFHFLNLPRAPSSSCLSAAEMFLPLPSPAPSWLTPFWSPLLRLPCPFGPCSPTWHWWKNSSPYSVCLSHFPVVCPFPSTGGGSAHISEWMHAWVKWTCFLKMVDSLEIKCTKPSRMLYRNHAHRPMCTDSMLTFL